MAHGLSDYGNKIRAILNWSETDGPEHFDPTFIERLGEALENSGRLSVKQMEAVDNIIEKFDIDVEAY